MFDLSVDAHGQFGTASPLHTSPKQSDASCSFQVDDNNAYKKEGTPVTPLSLLLVFVLVSCCLTGLLLGYDLCVVSTILEPIKNDFDFCPAQIIQPSSLYAAESVFFSEDSTDVNSTTANRRLAASNPTFFSTKPRRNLQPSPCYMNRQLQQVRDSSDGVDPTSSSNDQKSDAGSFKSCPSGQRFVSIISPGAALGSLFSGPFADYAGRILTLALADLFIMSGTLLMAFASTYHALFLGRFTLGIGIGVGFVIFSTYITECSPENWRGRMVSSIEVAQCVGCLASFAATAVIGNDQWRWLLTAAGSVAGIQLLGVFLLPESPRWYIRKNQPLKAENSLRTLSGLPKLPEVKRSCCWMQPKSAVVRVSSNDGENDAEAEVRVGDHYEDISQKRKDERIKQTEAGVRTTMKKMIDEYQKENQIRRCSERSQEEDASANVDDCEYLRFSSNVNDKVIEKKLYRRESSQTTAELATQNSSTSSSSSNNSNHTDGNSNYLGDGVHPEAFDSDEDSKSVCDGNSNSVGGKTDTSSLNKDPTNARCLSLPSSGRPGSCDKTTVFTKCKRHYRQLLISVGCAFCQNLTASTAVLYYSTELFQLGDVGRPFLAGIGIGVAKIFGILAVIFLIERIGRRNFLLIGTTCTLLCHLGFAVCYSALQTINIHLTSILITIIMFIFMFSQNISWAGLMFVVSSEVLPSSVRGIGMTLTITSFWLLAYLTQRTFETLMELLTIGGVFLFYSGTTFLALLFTYFWIPDFSGHSLEEITRIFEERKQKKRKVENARI